MLMRVPKVVAVVAAVAPRFVERMDGKRLRYHDIIEPNGLPSGMRSG